jgi:hypothetical protein
MSGWRGSVNVSTIIDSYPGSALVDANVLAAPRASGLLFAIGFGLFIPQFYLPAGARIAHGVLVAIGCLWLAAALWRADGPQDVRSVAAPRPQNAATQNAQA